MNDLAMKCKDYGMVIRILRLPFIVQLFSPKPKAHSP